jgi:tRNA A58 N-methylase Trm61
VISDDAKSKLRRLMETRQARDEAKKALEIAEENFRETESDVYEALDEDAVVGTIKVDLGDPWGVVAFRNRETYFGRIIDEEAALAHFEQRAMVEEVSAPKFVKRRINEIVRDALEQDGKMPPGLDYYAQRGVTITRQK